MWYVETHVCIRGILKEVCGVPFSMDCYYICEKDGGNVS